MSPEQRAKAVAEQFAAELPSRSVPELERIVTSAIGRALGQHLAELEDWAKRSAEYAMGRTVQPVPDGINCGQGFTR